MSGMTQAVMRDPLQGLWVPGGETWLNLGASLKV